MTAAGTRLVPAMPPSLDAAPRGNGLEGCGDAFRRRGPRPARHGEADWYILMLEARGAAPVGGLIGPVENGSGPPGSWIEGRALFQFPPCPS
jgi:hypothetical protein